LYAYSSVLRNLASSRIPRYDLGRQTLHFWGGSVTVSPLNRCGSIRETTEKVFQVILTLDFHFCHRFLRARRMKVPQRSPPMSCVKAVPQLPLTSTPESRCDHHCSAPQPVPHLPPTPTRHPRRSHIAAAALPATRPCVGAALLPWPSAIGRERERVVRLDNQWEKERWRGNKKERKKEKRKWFVYFFKIHWPYFTMTCIL
jgi:hypothetical protein